MVANPGQAQEYAVEARRRVAGQSQELVLVEADLSTEGKEVLYGKIDEPSRSLIIWRWFSPGMCGRRFTGLMWSRSMNTW